MKKYGNIEILDDKGWDLEQAIPTEDWKAEEIDMKIPSDFGMGITTRYEGKEYTFKRNPHKKPTVTLEITTWRGQCADAIHYYGKLNIDLPEMEENSRPGHTVGVYGRDGIPMFSNDVMELTQVLEQWEIEKYPHQYRNCLAGKRHDGFYAISGVERRGKEVFEKIFGEGWTLKIEKRF